MNDETNSLRFDLKFCHEVTSHTCVLWSIRWTVFGRVDRSDWFGQPPHCLQVDWRGPRHLHLLAPRPTKAVHFGYKLCLLLRRGVPVCHCVTLPIASSVLSQPCVRPSCVVKCLLPPGIKRVSFHRLTVGRWETAQKSYHSCVRRKVKSMNRRPRPDVPPRMWVLLDSKWCAFICFFQEKLAVFRFLLLKTSTNILVLLAINNWVDCSELLSLY